MSINHEAFTQLKRVLNESKEGKLKTKFDMDKFVDDNKCGTAACAAGSAGLDSWFRSQGFKTVKTQGNVFYRLKRYTFQGFEAAEKFFGITYDESSFLFEPAEYEVGYRDAVTEDMVLSHIDILLKEYQDREAAEAKEKAEEEKDKEECRFIKMLLADIKRTNQPLHEAMADLEQDKVDIVLKALAQWSNDYE